ncbi:MAG TPA: type II secretion system protein, partial [Candidatus Vogelbacteria bacterium]|nr:type II secretion system protein [Candidatus Vogelbacteria bacterium]
MILLKFKKRGFTLIEMLVAVAIFFIVTGAILINIPQFRNRVNIDLIAGEVSLYIRSAQVYAMG